MEPLKFRHRVPEANEEHNRTEKNKCGVPKVINTRSNGLSNAADVVGCKVKVTLPPAPFPLSK